MTAQRLIPVPIVALTVLLFTFACSSDPEPTPTPSGDTVVDARVQALKDESEAKGLRFLSREEILEGAQREGKLVVVPGFDDVAFPAVKEKFEERYPFISLSIEAVSGSAAGERLNFDMMSGRADVDIIEASSDDWALYAENGLLLPFDYESMARAGELAISPEAILHTDAGQIPFFGSGIDVIAYNTNMVSAEESPKTWEDCLDPKWKNMIAVDTNTALPGLLGAWTEEEIVAYAGKIADNEPLFVRGITATLVRMLGGEIAIMCPTNYHGALRQLIKDPTAPLAWNFPDPLTVGPRETEAIYIAAKHPHAALLFMEFVSDPDIQINVLSPHDPGKASYLIEGTVPFNLMRDFKGNINLCTAECMARDPDIAQRIVVEGWGFPSIGAAP